MLHSSNNFFRVRYYMKYSQSVNGDTYKYFYPLLVDDGTPCRLANNVLGVGTYIAYNYGQILIISWKYPDHISWSDHARRYHDFNVRMIKIRSGYNHTILSYRVNIYNVFMLILPTVRSNAGTLIGRYRQGGLLYAPSYIAEALHLPECWEGKGHLGYNHLWDVEQ